MRVNIIVAASVNGVIGRDGGLPWSLPEDLEWFRRCTHGCPVIMGRRTWNSIRRPLGGRVVIVVSTTKRGSRIPGVLVAPSLDVALELAAQTFAKPPPAVWIAGGAALYRAALPIASGLYFTRVYAHVQGDTHFPRWEPKAWQLVAEQHVRRPPSELLAAPYGAPVGFSHLVYRRPPVVGLSPFSS